MINKVIIILYLLHGIAVFGQAKKYYKKGEILNKKFLKSVSYDIQPTKKIVIKGISINGSKRKYNFLFDTGSTSSFISTKVANEIGFRTTIKDSVSDGYTFRQTEFGFINLDIEGVKFNNIIVGISDNNYDILCDIDGIIGYNMMQLCVWQIDLPGHKIIISNSVKNLDKINSYYKQYLKIIDCSPFVMCGFQSIFRGDMLIDLGDNAAITLNKSYNYLKKRGETIKSKGFAIQSSFNLEFDTTKGFELIRFNKFNFGKTSKRKVENTNNFISDPVAYLFDFNQSNVIGAGILDNYAVIFDFPHKKIYTKITANKYIGFRSFGFAIMPYNGEYVVATVWNKSEAQKTGITAGDIVLKINNLNLAESKHQPVCSIYLKIEKELVNNDKIMITIKNKSGITSSYTIQKQDLFN